MKTNQIMIRPMGEFKVIQRTKDAFFNARFIKTVESIKRNEERS